jgi:hypothetical protein
MPRCRDGKKTSCDQIAENPDDLPVPESHIALAEQRLANFRRNPTLARPAFEELGRLIKKFGG